MKRKSLLSLMVVVALMVASISVPSFATNPTFKLEGKVVLPGTDVAPEGGLNVTIEYRSDKATTDTADDLINTIVVPLAKDTREAFFSVNIPFSVTGAKFSLSYLVPPASQYWDKGYYSLTGMQYYKEGQMLFPEGSVADLIITPLRASQITGTVGLPVYSATPTAITVDVKAKTAGILDGAADDYEAKTSVSITNSAVAYSLKVPSTATTAGYIVMYETNSSEYVKKGWYSTLGTVTTPSAASKVDVSTGNKTGINLLLVKSSVVPPVTPPVTPPAIMFDLNGDGVVDVKDQVIITRLMGPKAKFIAAFAAFDLNHDGIINVKDLKIIKEEIGKYKRVKNHEKHKHSDK